MFETWDIGRGLINSCVYYTLQVVPYSVGFKAPRELWNLLSKTVLSKCSLYGINDL